MKYVSALGIAILLVPQPPGDAWLCVCFDGNGRWQSMSHHATRDDARKRRAWLFRYHRKLAAERKGRGGKTAEG